MYEGLTRDLVRRAVFAQLDLRVVDGKVRDRDGQLSGQIDCMLVEGTGEPIPYTESFVYPIDQVVAVIEVKKNLYSKDLKDAYANLRTVSELGRHDNPNLGLARSAFRAIAQRDAAAEDLARLPPELQMLFQCLAKDSIMPARIVLGYFGFSSEVSLREHLIKYLAAELSSGTKVGEAGVLGFGPGSFPSLILCKEAALLKLNAMPYGSPIVDALGLAPFDNQDGWWPFYGSMGGRNGLALLEIIWTRLRDRYGLSSSIFGDDLEVEEFTPLLFGKPTPGRGWELLSYEVAGDHLKYSSVEWVPAIITEIQAEALLYLGVHGEIEVDSDDALQNYCDRANSTKEEFLSGLVETKLVFIDAERRLRFLTYECQTVFLPDGRIAAADNSTGRLTRWANMQREARKN